MIVAVSPRLEDIQGFVRQSAISALARLAEKGDAGAIAAVSRRLEDHDKMVQRDAKSSPADDLTAPMRAARVLSPQISANPNATAVDGRIALLILFFPNDVELCTIFSAWISNKVRFLILLEQTAWFEDLASAYVHM